MIPAGTNATEARATALKLSRANPGMYVTIFSCFGAYCHMGKSLHVNAPTDSWGKSYWLNGVEKPFTSAQRLADDLATPTMS